MKFTLGFSPCPNDTFIFDALINHKFDTEGLHFDVHLEDVQTLNNWAREGKLDISKISYGVLPLLTESHVVLASGGALGQGVGPLLISNKEVSEAEINESVIAIPGENTTAHMLFSLAYPNAKNKVFKVFNEIEDFVLSRKGLGVIIHENRFTYAEKGLTKVVDLGDYWEKTTGSPIPLGGIVAKRNIPLPMIKKIDNAIRKSVEYAYENHYIDNLPDYIKEHSQEMSEDVMRQHIQLYVNSFSFKLGKAGRDAVREMLKVYLNIHPEAKLSELEIFASKLY
ncbi:1,4-dihydroxy-6-naphthoate synthase [Arachidicoccus ginsenosidimutans]|uniref:1,4-dihydroxy-6-naphthoate synthase n=1 Tax=Arachidicoccus sp. BS20 TaxID=1850526 RepID=UPI0007F06BBF|nr:1,4-dihydroxy-6-naphthoate synthase [Arachidicoccus sp. BS20]ANI89436.1 1,4-dihydroxy-6-naphthoate synthase [Arachidicoccus sp. BS20]